MKASKAGRPRKSGDRYPSGDLKPQVTANQIKRAMAAALAAGRNSYLATQLGQLTIMPDGDTGKPLITAEQCEAGLAFARLFDDFAREMGFPRRSARSGAMERASAGVVADAHDECTGEARRRYEAASKPLSDAGVLKVVVAVCVDDQAVRWDHKRELVLGLRMLERHFGLRSVKRIDKSARV